MNLENNCVVWMITSSSQWLANNLEISPDALCESLWGSYNILGFGAKTFSKGLRHQSS